MEVESPYKDLVCPVPKVMLGDYLVQAARRRIDTKGDGYWVTDVSLDVHLRYSDIEPKSRSVGSALTKMGFKSQDVMMYVTTNSCQVFAVFVGVWRLNGIIQPSYPEDKLDTLVGRMTAAKCRFITCDKDTAPSVLAACHELEWSVNVFCFEPLDGTTHVDNLFNDDGSSLPATVDYKEDDTVAIPCSGGTTGVSKGAVHSHKSLLTFLEYNRWLLPKIRNGIIFSTIRVFHLGGMIFPPLIMVRSAHMLLMSTSNSDILASSVHKYKPSVLFGFPTTLMWTVTNPKAHEYDYSSVEGIITGGAPITVAQQEKLQVVLPNLQAIHLLYGMTECLIATCTIDAERETSEEQEALRYVDSPEDSVGKPLPCVKIKVVDVTTEKALAPNICGELWVKSPMLMKEYFNNPEATAMSIEDGWIHTGDYGYYDDNGVFYIKDRLKETFKYWNYHISPVELEEVITRNDEVIEACVIGVPDPDGGDSIPKAYVVKKSGSNLTEEALKEYVHAQVASYKQLRGGVVFLDQLPKSQAGKVSRQQLLLKIREGLVP